MRATGLSARAGTATASAWPCSTMPQNPCWPGVSPEAVAGPLPAAASLIAGSARARIMGWIGRAAGPNPQGITNNTTCCKIPGSRRAIPANVQSPAVEPETLCPSAIARPSAGLCIVLGIGMYLASAIPAELRRPKPYHDPGTERSPDPGLGRLNCGAGAERLRLPTVIEGIRQLPNVVFRAKSGETKDGANPIITSGL